MQEGALERVDVRGGAMEQMHHRFRLLTEPGGGIAGRLPETWRSYSNVQEARLGALAMLRDPRVRRVAIVDDINVLELVEWIVSRNHVDAPVTSVAGSR
jgi:hypothetical protein